MCPLIERILYVNFYSGKCGRPLDTIQSVRIREIVQYCYHRKDNRCLDDGHCIAIVRYRERPLIEIPLYMYFNYYMIEIHIHVHIIIHTLHI
jgi:hypothetical protein